MTTYRVLLERTRIITERAVVEVTADSRLSAMRAAPGKARNFTEFQQITNSPVAAKVISEQASGPPRLDELPPPPPTPAPPPTPPPSPSPSPSPPPAPSPPPSPTPPSFSAHGDQNADL